jgi:prepilin-type N-terminal cleavage/methylation domain-containing protein
MSVRRGFTLIEVVAALVIFSAGVLVALRLTTALARELANSATRSELEVQVQARVDSLVAVPWSGLGTESRTDTLRVRGRSFRITIRILPVSPRLREIRVEATPDPPPGPGYSATVLRRDEA